MPLTSMKPLLRHARQEGYGIAAFNPVDYVTAKAIVRAAEEAQAPVIAQTSVKTVKYWGASTIAGWMRELAGNASVPVSLHVDHCKDIEIIKLCIESGWTDVMIDASSLSFEENLALSSQVCDLANPRGVGVEAELGEIGGVEEDIKVDLDKAHLVDPVKAAIFLEKLDLAVFAPAIGTAHGIYKGEPKVDFKLLELLFDQTSVPFALHGGTGLPDEVFTKCIQLGCAKVNISTQLKYAFIDGFCDFHRDNPSVYEPLAVIEGQYQNCYQMVLDRIRQFGAAGKAKALTEERS